MPRLVTVERNGSSSATASIAIDVPAGVEDGDFLVVHLGGGGPVAFSESGSSDFTEEVDLATATGAQRCALGVYVQEVADAGALPASYTFALSPSRAVTAAMYVVRGASGYAVGTPVVNETAATTCVIPGVTAAADDLVLAMIARFGTDDPFYPQATYPMINRHRLAAAAISAGFRVVGAGATGTVTFTSIDTAQSIGALVHFADAAVTGMRVARGLRSTTTATTNHVVTVPAHVNGDLLVMIGGAEDENGLTVPGAWTEVFKNSGGTGVTGGAWLRVASSEPADYTLTTPNAVDGSWVVLVVKGYGSTTPTLGTVHNASVGSVTLSGITPSAAGMMFGAIVKAGRRNLGDGVTPIDDGTFVGASDAVTMTTLWSFEDVIAAATGTRTFGITGSNSTSIGALFSLEAAAGGQNIPVGQASEAETANPITPMISRVVQVGQATEQEVANPITVRISREVTLGQAVEVELARAVTPVITGPIFVNLGQAVERELARSITPFISGVGLIDVECEILSPTATCAILSPTAECEVA